MIGPRHGLGRRRSFDVIHPAGVVLQHLAHDRLSDDLGVPPDHLRRRGRKARRSGMQTRGVRKVRLEHDVVLVLGQELQRVGLEPEHGVHLPPEVLARQESVRVAPTRVRVHPLPVEAVEEERDVAESALDGHEVEPGKTVAHSAGQEEPYRPDVADEGHGRPGRVGSRVIRLPVHGLIDLLGGVAHADMEVDRHPEVLRFGVERVPVRVAEVGKPMLLERRGPQDAPVAQAMAAAQLGDGGSEIPERKHGERHEAIGSDGRELGLVVVVGLDAGEFQALVL